METAEECVLVFGNDKIILDYGKCNIHVYVNIKLSFSGINVCVFFLTK